MSSLTVPCDNNVAVSATGELVHRCPFVDEVDNGTITITWLPDGETFELHALAEYLRGFENSRLSHEEITDRIAFDLIVPGIVGVTVTTSWTTAGFTVHATTGGADALPREPLSRAGA